MSRHYNWEHDLAPQGPSSAKTVNCRQVVTTVQCRVQLHHSIDVGHVMYTTGHVTAADSKTGDIRTILLPRDAL